MMRKPTNQNCRILYFSWVELMMCSFIQTPKKKRILHYFSLFCQLNFHADLMFVYTVKITRRNLQFCEQKMVYLEQQHNEQNDVAAQGKNGDLIIYGTHKVYVFADGTVFNFSKLWAICGKNTFILSVVVSLVLCIIWPGGYESKFLGQPNIC